MKGKQVVRQGWIVANWYVCDRIAGGLAVPELNQTFFYQCLKGVMVGGYKQNANTAVPGLATVIGKYVAARSPHYLPPNLYEFTGFL